jgi:hypothetical protein
MKTAQINLTTPYEVRVIPTIMQFSLVQDLFKKDGVSLCQINFKLLCTKFIKQVAKLDEAGEPVLKAGKQVLEDKIFDFNSPVLFDEGSKVIPFQLYLLIESYRASKDADQLAMINEALTQFSFGGSLSTFVLNVNDIE